MRVEREFSPLTIRIDSEKERDLLNEILMSYINHLSSKRTIGFYRGTPIGHEAVYLAQAIYDKIK